MQRHAVRGLVAAAAGVFVQEEAPSDDGADHALLRRIDHGRRARLEPHLDGSPSTALHARLPRVVIIGKGSGQRA